MTPEKLAALVSQPPAGLEVLPRTRRESRIDVGKRLGHDQLVGNEKRPDLPDRRRPTPGQGASRAEIVTPTAKVGLTLVVEPPQVSEDKAGNRLDMDPVRRLEVLGSNYRVATNLLPPHVTVARPTQIPGMVE